MIEGSFPPVSARPARNEDLGTLVHLYQGLEWEMEGLHPMWPLADGLAEPVAAAFEEALSSPDAMIVIGEIEGFPVGFALATIDALRPRAAGERIGSIRLIYVDPEARAVGVGEAIAEELLERLRARGVERFDAYVLPGHRLVKNFFESAGFSARSIVMHRG